MTKMTIPHLSKHKAIHYKEWKMQSLKDTFIKQISNQKWSLHHNAHFLSLQLCMLGRFSSIELKTTSGEILPIDRSIFMGSRFKYTKVYSTVEPFCLRQPISLKKYADVFERLCGSSSLTSRSCLRKTLVWWHWWTAVFLSPSYIF